MPAFPKGMPDSGEMVPRDPAEMIRDVFFANQGRIAADLVDNMIGRHTFTYGHEINKAWKDLQDPQGMGSVVRDGADWVWPCAVPAVQPVRVQIENAYSNGHESECIVELEPPGPTDAELEEWWEDTVHAQTGDGTGIDSSLGFWYGATVLETSDPRLVGQSREWSG